MQLIQGHHVHLLKSYVMKYSWLFQFKVQLIFHLNSISFSFIVADSGPMSILY